jgi:hypothetical protein
VSWGLYVDLSLAHHSFVLLWYERIKSMSVLQRREWSSMHVKGDVADDLVGVSLSRIVEQKHLDCQYVVERAKRIVSKEMED